MVLRYTDLLDFYELCNKNQLYLRDFEFLIKVSGMDKEFNNEDSLRTNLLSKLRQLGNSGYIEIKTRQPKHVYLVSEKGISFLAAKRLQLALAAKAGSELSKVA